MSRVWRMCRYEDVGRCVGRVWGGCVGKDGCSCCKCGQGLETQAGRQAHEQGVAHVQVWECVEVWRGVGVKWVAAAARTKAGRQACNQGKRTCRCEGVGDGVENVWACAAGCPSSSNTVHLLHLAPLLPHTLLLCFPALYSSPPQNPVSCFPQTLSLASPTPCPSLPPHPAPTFPHTLLHTLRLTFPTPWLQTYLHSNSCRHAMMVNYFSPNALPLEGPCRYVEGWEKPQAGGGRGHREGDEQGVCKGETGMKTNGQVSQSDTAPLDGLCRCVEGWAGGEGEGRGRGTGVISEAHKREVNVGWSSCSAPTLCRWTGPAGVWSAGLGEREGDGGQM